MTATDQVSRDAQVLLDAMLEEARKKIAPHWQAERWRIAARELMNAGFAKIYQVGRNRYAFRLTPEGEKIVGLR